MKFKNKYIKNKKYFYLVFDISYKYIMYSNQTVALPSLVPLLIPPDLFSSTSSLLFSLHWVLAESLQIPNHNALKGAKQLWTLPEVPFSCLMMEVRL